MTDRKYRHRGYQDSDRERDERRPPERQGEPARPRMEGAPRGRGLGAPTAAVFKCSACGREVNTTLKEITAAVDLPRLRSPPPQLHQLRVLRPGGDVRVPQAGPRADREQGRRQRLPPVPAEDHPRPAGHLSGFTRRRPGRLRRAVQEEVSQRSAVSLRSHRPTRIPRKAATGSKGAGEPALRLGCSLAIRRGSKTSVRLGEILIALWEDRWRRAYNPLTARARSASGSDLQRQVAPAPLAASAVESWAALAAAASSRRSSQ